MNPKGMRKWNLDPNANPGIYDVKPKGKQVLLGK